MRSIWRRRVCTLVLSCAWPVLNGCGAGDGTASPSAGGGAAGNVAADPPLEPAPKARGRIKLTPLGRHVHGTFNGLASEIPAYDAASKRLFVVNVEKRAIDVLDIADPAEPKFVVACDVRSYGDKPASVTAKHGLIAATVITQSKRERGQVVFLSPEGAVLKALQVGHEPDMLTFTPDGHWLLVANEGEPEQDYSFDPEGTVSLIDVSGGIDAISQDQVTELNFQAFNDRTTLDPNVRIFGRGAGVAQDLEPEYIAIAPDSQRAWVVCQENNALGLIDLGAKQITKVVGLGFKDHNQPGAGLDASDKDGLVRIRPWPVKGMYQPDALVAFAAAGAVYLISANEGEAREYSAFSEVVRVKDLQLDPQAFPNAAELQNPKVLGRLRTSSVMGDRNGDGKVEEIYSHGGRSFSIWSAEGTLVFDSGDQFERIIAERHPQHFNVDSESQRMDDRSDNKGPEPEGAAVGELGGRTYAFIGLERMGGVMVYDVTDPAAPVFEDYVTTRDFAGQPQNGTAGDLGPEGLLFIPAGESPSGAPLLVVCNEVSGTTRIFGLSTAHP